MRICLCTLILNEIEWLQKLYDQHKNWPGLVKWVFVEAADEVYAQTNPDMVTSSGLSVDGTSELLMQLAAQDERVVYIPHGFTKDTDLAQGKCEARNRYLAEMESVEPSYFIVVDADEFYPLKSQTEIPFYLNQRRDSWGFCLKHREIWHPPSLGSETPLFTYEVTGGFWSIPYCRIWKWFPNLTYLNHNTPSIVNGSPLDRKLVRYDQKYRMPYFVHLGFASQLKTRASKNRYYEARGEAVDKKRRWYCESRACFETWTPGIALPNGAKVINYDGIVPECFIN